MLKLPKMVSIVRLPLWLLVCLPFTSLANSPLIENPSGLFERDPNKLSYELITLTNDSILYSNRTKDQVERYELDGTLNRVYKTDDGHDLVWSAYLDTYDVVVLVQNKKDDGTYGLIYFEEAYFSDDEMHPPKTGDVQLLGFDKKPLEPYFVQLMENGTRFYLNLIANSSLKKLGKQFGEKEIFEADVFFDVDESNNNTLNIRLSAAIERVSSLEVYPDINRRWFADGKNGNILSVNQQVNGVATYRPVVGKRPVLEPLGSPKRVIPNKNWVAGVSPRPNGVSFKKWSRWYNSSTKIVGFLRLHDGRYLLAYRNPNNEHLYYNDESDRDDVPLWRLHVDILDSDLKNTGSLMDVAGGFFLGVRGEECLYLKPNGNDSAPRLDVVRQMIE